MFGVFMGWEGDGYNGGRWMGNGGWDGEDGFGAVGLRWRRGEGVVPVLAGRYGR